MSGLPWRTASGPRTANGRQIVSELGPFTPNSGYRDGTWACPSDARFRPNASPATLLHEERRPIECALRAAGLEKVLGHAKHEN
jgi:hypothetical protein